MLEKHNHANISRFDALIAATMHAVHGDPGSILFTSAQVGTPDVCTLGPDSDLDPDNWPIFRDLDEARQPASSSTRLSKQKALEVSRDHPSCKQKMS